MHYLRVVIFPIFEKYYIIDITISAKHSEVVLPSAVSFPHETTQLWQLRQLDGSQLPLNRSPRVTFNFLRKAPVSQLVKGL